MNDNLQNRKTEVCARIIEQPYKSVKFRFEIKGNNKAVIHGRHGRKSFPTICVENYSGPVSVIVSCVTSDPPYRPHPHQLCNRSKLQVHGACLFDIAEEEVHEICFKSLYIRPTMERDIEQTLSDRRQIMIDPFKTGYDHQYNTDSIDLKAVRLCFQVYLEHADRSQTPIPLEPVLSDPIFIKIIGCGLTICWLSHDAASAAGGTKMCLLCERVPNNDIDVVFYSEKGDWKASGTIVAPDIFKHAAIVFKTPEYRTKNCKPEDVKEPINAYIQLRRISQDDISTPRAFQIFPIDYDECNTEENSLKRKRSKHTYLSNMMTQKDSQAEIILKHHVLNTHETLNLNNKTIEPWELPHLSQYPNLQPTQATININTNVTNTCNPMACQNQASLNRTGELLNVQTGTVELREHPHYQQFMHPLVQITRVNNNTNTLHNAPEKVYKQLNENPCIIPYKRNSEKQQQTCNSTDTLNSDGWIKDLLNGIESDDCSTLQKTGCNLIAENIIAPEPENRYIIPNDSTLQPLDNMGNNNINVMDMNLEQMDNFFNHNDIATNTVQEQDYAINDFNDIDNPPNDELNSSHSKSSIQEFIESVSAMYSETY